MNRRTTAIFSLVTLLSLLWGAPLLAQNFQGANTLQNIASEGQSLGKYVVNIAFIFCGIAGALCLIPAAIKAFKGETQSKDAITNVGLGFIAVFIFLAVVKAIMAFN